MKFKAKYVMIHFKPIELYPPAQNFIGFMGKSESENLLVLTTGSPKNNLKEFDPGMHNIFIKRFDAIKLHSPLRIIHYCKFYIGSLIQLLKHRPVSVLYFESMSSWPALMYKKLKGDKVQLMVHYHEYSSPTEYGSGMRLVTEMYKMEKKMYGDSFDWISHTNEKRLADFKIDNSIQGLAKDIFFTMPNYPSKYWAHDPVKNIPGSSIKLVYVGALGFDNMYLQETLEWIQKNEMLSLDIYANIIDEKATRFIQNFNCNRIHFHGGINYSQVPYMLQEYHVGLVMYKPFNENTVNAVSNKVFEYLACGLDVWFSKDMTYTLQYSRQDVYPKVVPVDFNNLDGFDYKSYAGKSGIPYQATDYYCENVYPEIQAKMAAK